ncbi:uncharacterized protein LOC125547228 [Triticum urartu]|uniref:uncharacterized protein LOC125547228 n=1 Tax=Triticum urartu TaxID=4572 RepID=UPI0020437128|nr:uncharacterized protein LOC125547228 [Triticum urartu]
MAEMVKSVIVGEAVSRIISGIAPTSKDEDKADEEASGRGLERLEMARIKMEAALQTSNKWQITDTSLLRWQKKLKRTAQDCDDVARRCRQLSREEDEAEQVVRKSSFPRRMAHATKVFVSSFVGGGNDHRSAGSVTAAVVRRFERLADGADEFIRYVQIGGTPRQNLFFDPLTGHLFTGKMIAYQLLRPGGQYHYFRIRPINFQERGLEAFLSFMYEDCKVPKNSFCLGVMLRLSESTDIIGTVLKCLRVMTPHFNSMTDIVIKEIIHLPTQDFSYVAHKKHWVHVHRTLTEWFRPDPLCCQGFEHDVVRSCHSGSDSSNGSRNKLKFSSIFPEPVCHVFFQCHTSLSEYKNLPGSAVFAGHDESSSLENSQPLKIGILLMPHASLEDPKSVGSTIEVIDTTNRHHLTHVNVHLDQLDEMMMPKAIDYLHLNAEAMSYQWTDYHNFVATMVSCGDGSDSSEGFGGNSFCSWNFIMSSRIRKHESGAAKRKKKQRLEVEAQSLTGSLDRYLVKDPRHNSENQTADVNVDDGCDDNVTEVEAHDAEIDDGNIASEGGDGNIADGGDDVFF